MLKVLCLVLSGLVPAASAEDMYCGPRNCYEVLGLTKEASPAEIKKVYFKMSLKYHPDKVAEEEREQATARFMEVSTAYEVLTKAKANYDEVLANPGRFWRNHYNYYAFTFEHHTNPWVVVLGAFLFASVCHYLYWQSRYNLLRKHISRQLKVQQRLAAKQQEVQAAGGDPSAVTLEDIEVVIGGWQGRQPHWDDVLLFHCLFAPLKIYQYLYWVSRWTIKFSLLKHAFGTEEKEFLTAKALRIPWSTWDLQLPEQDKHDYMAKDLWLPKNFALYIKEMRSARSGKAKYGKGRR